MAQEAASSHLPRVCRRHNTTDSRREEFIGPGSENSQASSVVGQVCVMRPVRLGSPKLLPCCLRDDWRHVGCSYQTHLGRVCPCHIRILDPKLKIMGLSHPYMEDYVVLPSRAAVRTENRLTAR